ncbi:protein kinase activating protein dpb11 [Coemansia thaxteri]|nr:protein kinase activating protein dpb11 [Coemansia thaxteri]
MKEANLFCQKYYVSAKVGIPVVSLDFVSECELEAMERGDNSNTVECTVAEAVHQITARNRFLPFAGCRISSTGLQSELRAEIERLVENTCLASTSLLAKHMEDGLSSRAGRGGGLIGGGGLYCGVLTGDCTHLIALGSEGEKFKFAKDRSIPVVTLEWFVQSLGAGARQQENDYAVGYADQPSRSTTNVTIAGNMRRLQSLGQTEKSTKRIDDLASNPRRHGAHALAPGFERTVSAASDQSAVPPTREYSSGCALPHQGGSVVSRGLTRNCTANGSLHADSLDLPPGLSGPLLVDSEEESDVVLVGCGNGAGADKGIFAQCVFSSLGLTSQAAATLDQVVRENGGSCVVMQDPKTRLEHELMALAGKFDGALIMDVYILIQLRDTDLLATCEAAICLPPFMHIVTECWVEQCIQDEVRYPDYVAIQALRLPYPGLGPGQHVLFRPLSSHQIAGASSVSLSISGYEGIERDHIGKLTQALGIAYSETFSRRTTHLICHPPFKGQKYERALKWGVCVVDSSWLYGVVAAGRVGEHKVGEGYLMASPEQAPESHTHDHGKMAAPSAVTCASKHVHTPATRSTQRLVSDTPGRTPMDISLERNLQQALGNNRACRRPAHCGDESDGGGDSDATQMSPTHGHNFGRGVASVPPSADGGDGNGTTSVLSGVVAVLSSRLYHRRNELTALALQLGCRVLLRFDSKQTTHFIHQSNRERETLRDYRLALQHGVRIVSPWWLYACRDMMALAPEDQFPYTYDPERRLLLSSTLPALPAQQSADKLDSSTSSINRHLESRSNGQLSSAHASHGHVLESTTRLIDSTRTVPLSAQGADSAAAVDAHEIDSLLGMKAASTRRKYRQSSPSRTGHETIDILTTKQHAGGDLQLSSSTVKQSEYAQGLRQHSSDISASKGETRLVGRGPSTNACQAPQHWRADSQTPEKWWLDVDSVVAGAGGGAEYQASLYSQEHPPTGYQGLDSMPSTNVPYGLPNTSGVSTDDADWHTTSRLDSRQASAKGGLHFNGDGPCEPSAKQGISLEANAPAATTLSSPLAAHKTTIVYGEDSEALSERDRLIQRLIGK